MAVKKYFKIIICACFVILAFGDLPLCSAEELKVGLIQMVIRPGDFNFTLAQHIQGTRKLAKRGAKLIVAPEGIYPGYPSNDMLRSRDYIARSNEAVAAFVDQTKDLDVFSVFGRVNINPSPTGRELVNDLNIAYKGKIVFEQSKMLLPTYGVFEDARYFEPGVKIKIFDQIPGFRVAFLICEDSWFYSRQNGRLIYKHNPIKRIQNLDPDLVVIISASPYTDGKQAIRLGEDQVKGVQKLVKKPVIAVNQVAAIDQLIMDGASFGVDTNGDVAFKLRDFAPDLAVVSVTKHEGNMAPLRVELPPKEERDSKTDPMRKPVFRSNVELGIEATSFHLREMVRLTGHHAVTFGLSGGLDSAMAAAHAVRAVGAENVFPILMPYTPNSSKGSIDHSYQLCRNLGIPEANILRIPIDPVMEGFYKMFEGMGLTKEFLEQVKFADVAIENIQARTRMIVEFFISNLAGDVKPEFKPLKEELIRRDPRWATFFETRKTKLFTGDKSELLIGNATLFGDASGVIGVNADKYKSRLYEEAYAMNAEAGFALIPREILDKEPSPELRSVQLTTDRFPPYRQVLDPILEDLYDNELTPAELHRKYDFLDTRPDLVRPHHQIEGSVVKYVMKIYADSEFKRQTINFLAAKVTRRTVGKEDRATIVAKKYQSVNILACQAQLATGVSLF